jgi:hypothetical protein
MLTSSDGFFSKARYHYLFVTMEYIKNSDIKKFLRKKRQYCAIQCRYSGYCLFFWQLLIWPTPHVQMHAQDTELVVSMM